MNHLDTFFQKGNAHFKTIAGDTFYWEDAAYTGSVSDLQLQEFFDNSGVGSKRETERLLEVAIIEFAGGNIPQIKDVIEYEHETYSIVEVESKDTTNIVWRIRLKIQDA